MASRRETREFVERMVNDPELGCRIWNAVYKVKGHTGRYLIIHKTTMQGKTAKVEIDTQYITDFVDLIYNAGREAKAVKV